MSDDNDAVLQAFVVRRPTGRARHLAAVWGVADMLPRRISVRNVVEQNARLVVTDIFE